MEFTKETIEQLFVKGAISLNGWRQLLDALEEFEKAKVRLRQIETGA
jgi:hypothetical protein